MTMIRKNNLSAMSREAILSVVRNEVVEVDEATIIFPLSSEEPYRRNYWKHGELDEILDHSRSAVDLGFMNGGSAPLIDSHNTYEGLDKQLGVVRRAWLKDSRLYVEVEFSTRPRALEILNDVRAGITTNVSVGYSVLKYEVDEENEIFRVTRWRPHEASFVLIPADTTVGVGRSKQEVVMTNTTRDPVLPGLDTRTDEQRSADLETAINEISALAAEHNMSDIGRAFITGAMTRGEEPSLALFRGVVRSTLPAGTPIVNNDVGLTDNERRQFSVMNVARAVLSGNWSGAEFEREVTAAAADIVPTSHDGVRLPDEVMRNWGDYSVGGVSSQSVRAAMSTGSNPNVLTTDHLAGSFVDNLRNMSAVLGAGATVLDGLDSDVDIPGGDQNATAAWLASEDANVAETVPTFRIFGLRPHDLGAFTDITRRMLQQPTISIEAYVRMQLVDAIRLEIDRAALYGTGATGIPEGLANITGIGSVTFAAAIPTRGEIIDLRTSIAETNRGRGVTYLGNSAMVGDLQKTKVDAGSGIFLMNDSADRLVGNAFRESNQVVDGDLFAGVWSDMLIGMWGGLELARSTEAKFLSGGIRLRGIQTMDVNVSRVGSFALGNDTP